jgi:hypothetical protein
MQNCKYKLALLPEVQVESVARLPNWYVASGNGFRSQSCQPSAFTSTPHMVCHLVLPRFGSELWSGPEPSRTGLGFGPESGAEAEPDQRSGSGSGVGPNLAEPFRTGSKPRTRRSKPHDDLTSALDYNIMQSTTLPALCSTPRHGAPPAVNITQHHPRDVRHAVGVRAVSWLLARGHVQRGVCPSPPSPSSRPT